MNFANEKLLLSLDFLQRETLRGPKQIYNIDSVKKEIKLAEWMNITRMESRDAKITEFENCEIINNCNWTIATVWQLLFSFYCSRVF